MLIQGLRNQRPYGPFTLLSLVLLGTLFARPALATDKYQLHVKRGRELLRTEEYTDALSQFEEAYALRQSPALLYQIARCHHRLGNVAEARNFYRRYLGTGINLTQQQRSAVENALQQLAELDSSSSLDDPQSPSWKRSSHRRSKRRNSHQSEAEQDNDEDREGAPTGQHSNQGRRRSPGMIIGGSILLGAAYLPALVMGTLGLLGSSSLQNSKLRDQVDAVSGTLLIPLAGPVISGGISQSVAWALPWILVDDAAQVAGFAMVISGARTVPAQNLANALEISTPPALSAAPIATVGFTF